MQSEAEKDARRKAKAARAAKADKAKQEKELLEQIDRQRMLIRALETDVANPDRMRAEIERHNAIVDEHKRKAAAVQARLDNTPALLEAASESLRRMHQKLKAIRLGDKLAELAKIKKALAEAERKGLTKEKILELLQNADV